MASSDISTNVSIPIPQYHVQKDIATSYLTEEVSVFFCSSNFYILCVSHSDWGINKLAISLGSIVQIVVSTIL